MSTDSTTRTVGLTPGNGSTQPAPAAASRKKRTTIAKDPVDVAIVRIGTILAGLASDEERGIVVRHVAARNQRLLNQ